MRADNTELFQDVSTVADHEHAAFAPDRYASAISRRHRFYLRQLVKRAFPYRRPVQHDFACGTGRAIRSLHGLVRMAHGYDSSAQMLARASESGVFASLHLVEVDGGSPEPAAEDAPVLVTIFRLLVHCDERVRERAVAFAAKALRNYDAGLLVVENHVDVTELLDRHGFTVVEKRGFSLFSRGWYGHRLLRPIANAVDNFVARTGWGSTWAVNVLYVARRTHCPP